MKLKQNELNNLLKPIIERLKKAEKFTIEQAPEICKEVVYVEIYQRLFVAIPLLLISLIFIIAIPFLAHHIALTENDSKAYAINLFIILPLSVLGVAYDMLVNAYIIHKSPKLTIIKKLSELVKNEN